MSRFFSMSVLVIAVLAGAGGARAAPSEAAISAHRDGMRLAKNNQLPEALEALQRAVQLDPGYTEAWADLGNTQLAAGDLKSAIRSFDAAVRQRPDLQIARYNLAYALRKTGSYAKAAEHYRLYLMRDPQDADAQYGLAEALKSAGDLFAAAEAYEDYSRIEKRPGQGKWVAKAEEQAKQLRAEAAKRAGTLVSSDELAPPEPPKRAAKTPPPAKSAPEPAKSATPPAKSAPEPAKRLSFSTQSKKEQAAVEAKSAEPKPAARASRPESFRAGLELLKKNDFEAALARLAIAAREAPEDSLVLAALAGAHLGMKHGREAEVTYRRALASASVYAQPALRFGLGESLRLQGETEKAIAAYRDAERDEQASESTKRLAKERIAALGQ